MNHRRRDDWRDDDGRPRRTAQSRRRQTNAILLLVLIGGGIGLALVAGLIVLVVVLGHGGGGVSSTSSRDPTFDQIQKGMSEAHVIDLLGDKAYIRVPGASGCWTYPRLTLDEFHQDPSRNRDVKDVITIYFRDGKVIDIYRQTGAEFRRPRPR